MTEREDHILFRDLGVMGYREAWDYQEKLFRRLVDHRRNPEPGSPPPQYLLFCEHPHVYTLGKSGDAHNLLIRDEFLRKINATYVRTNRGGDITYHGPGQIVGYPILDLQRLGIGLRKYVEILEEAIMALLGEHGIDSGRMEGATGVWLDAGNPAKARKICAIGIRSSRFVTMHGFALNVRTDLEYFTYINPCGLDTRGVTSLERETGTEVDQEAVKRALREILLSRFHAHLHPEG